MTELLNYEERVTVFIDILGFKDLLAETIVKDKEASQKKIQEIAKAYNIMRNILELDEPKKKGRLIRNNSREITIFSDCVVISFKASEPDEIFFTLLDLKGIIIELAVKGILCRGAVTHGPLIHTPKMLFGPALAEAYLLESKAALYPRVILHRDIIRLARKNAESASEEDIRYLLLKDSDGMYYIDYFQGAQDDLDDPEEDFPHYLKLLGDKIRKGLVGSSSPFKADVRIKYRWMKERYNKAVRYAQDEEYLNRLRKRGLYEAADSYAALKKINPYD